MCTMCELLEYQPCNLVLKGISTSGHLNQLSDKKPFLGGLIICVEGCAVLLLCVHV